MEKILSISVAAYNVEDCLGRCLDSFLCTDVKDELEIIVVNDGSKDGTALLAKDYAEKYPDIIKFIDKENGGHGSTINASILAASGRYYKVVDADDWVLKEGLEGLVNFLKSCDCDLVMNPYHYVDSGTMEQKSLRNPYTEKVIINKELKMEEAAEDVFIEMHALTYRTEIVKSMGPVIDEHCFYVDIEYALMPLEYIKTLICLDWPVYQYLVGQEQQSVNAGTMVKRRGQHYRVFKRLTSYYEEKKDILPDKIRSIILSRLRYMAVTQYKIIFRIEHEKSKEEAMELDAWLKRNSEEIYEGSSGGVMKIIKLHRKTGFALYRPFLALLGLRWKIKGKSDII